ncbi:LacI family DNA-binding transcriptional regulator [Oricola cellulosilytica]|uniref:LacI family DNA-binding transcriptional regulator n=1 Tax=Oricola cellulosilytica TaxID=1429082 RepID=A0A4R0P804_9HYPH|nr:LacI family DNA-binding transcriptional regulator [Oricola cellulosilytica]TCD13169.1 LacI family DNA-binding transcriptional regulator [Oricola cellulosilytica]
MNETFRPTLNDVARAAGVSTATVSRCLNEPDRVVPATRERVMRAVKDLGYTPDFGGRALASRRTKTVGAVIPTMENAIFARGLQAFQETLSEAGVTLLVAGSGYDSEREAEQVRALVGRGADGLLLIGLARPQATYDYLRQRGTPYVLAWNLGDTSDHFIGFDNLRAAAEIASKVIELGHRDIAMIAGVTSMNDRAADRVEGVRSAMRRAISEVKSFDVIEAPYTFEDGATAFDRLVRRTPRPTAVICGNDVLAVGAISRAKALGLGVPGDISITGFDDIDIASFVEPALTTVHVPHRRMGSAAAQVLLRLIANEPVEPRVEIGVEIVMRGSLGPPPGTTP